MIIYRVCKEMMGRAGSHRLRPGSNDDCSELANDWILRRVVGIRQIKGGQDPHRTRAPVVLGSLQRRI